MTPIIIAVRNPVGADNQGCDSRAIEWEGQTLSVAFLCSARSKAGKA